MLECMNVCIHVGSKVMGKGEGGPIDFRCSEIGLGNHRAVYLRDPGPNSPVILQTNSGDVVTICGDNKALIIQP